MVMLPDEIAADNSMIHLAYENIQSPKRTVDIYVNMCRIDASKKSKMSVWWYTSSDEMCANADSCEAQTFWTIQLASL